MSKKWKGKTCGYCGRQGASTEGDHVLARAFVLERFRTDLPQIPACKKCNNLKSALETDLCAIIPYGGDNPNAAEVMKTLGRPRLNKNLRLKRQVHGSLKAFWQRQPSGLIARSGTFYIDARKLEDWIKLLARGLSHFHWGSIFDDERFDISFAPQTDPIYLFYVLSLPSAAKAGPTSIGGDVLRYEGSLAFEKTGAAWRFVINRGMTIGGDTSGVRVDQFAVLITPRTEPRQASATFKA